MSIMKQCKSLDEKLGSDFANKILSQLRTSQRKLKERIIQFDRKRTMLSKGHPSLEFVLEAARRNIWLKFWDTALDHGASWDTALDHGESWGTALDHGESWDTALDHGEPGTKACVHPETTMHDSFQRHAESVFLNDVILLYLHDVCVLFPSSLYVLIS